MLVLKSFDEEMTKEKALELVNQYITFSIMSDTVTPEQHEYEQCLIFLRDYVQNH